MNQMTLCRLLTTHESEGFPAMSELEHRLRLTRTSSDGFTKRLWLSEPPNACAIGQTFIRQRQRQRAEVSLRDMIMRLSLQAGYGKDVAEVLTAPPLRETLAAHASA